MPIDENKVAEKETPVFEQLSEDRTAEADDKVESLPDDVGADKKTPLPSRSDSVADGGRQYAATPQIDDRVQSAVGSAGSWNFFTR